MNNFLDTTIKLLCNSHQMGRLIPKFLFKRAIRQVEIEISSVCNRQCEYCPQSIVKRPNQTMSDSVLQKIVSDLSSIDYSEQICLNLYNEPLMYKEHLFDIIKTFKRHLPKTRVMFSSNGDMLTQETLRGLYHSKLDALYVTMHPRKADNWSEQQIEYKIRNQVQKLDLPDQPLDIHQNAIYYNGLYQSMQVTIFSLNFVKVGVNRAGAMSNIEAARGVCRTAPCYRPLRDICVSYDGSVYPCCQFYHGLEANLPFLLGNILDSSLFDIFVSPQMSRFRKNAVSNAVKPHPCRTCTE